ncbi:hypothetical protein COY87_01940 [Candidatus Roizmanbacteria bacterium CG_4_10_14_0_8_um_filter_33_9]|uniref:Type II secretion system protein n=1 Tax=Candidatus Roizmanbacteria bacterium CG_4_10_14_0_8_um_filter_33_9 TaxID=1974826 RepID=A0A2M7QJT6_9BACT|nr:MAG: hypothetical protein COY87_01940 [Candidatus Roizmanbacteria bacterium CG_4_10_14_0_8_um_filter_33_9]
MKKGFTFIEILVVLAVISFTLPSLFAIIFTILQQETRIYALKDIKQQGDYALENMKFNIQQKGIRVVDVTYTNDVCPILTNPITTPIPTPAPRINVIDTELNTFSYYVDLEHKIASQSSVGAISYLTNTRVKIQNEGFTCYRTSSFSPPIIITSFDITDSGSIFTLPYHFTFKLRSY